MLTVFQLIILWLCFISLAAAIKHNVLRALLCSVLSCLILLEMTAIYLTGQWVDHRFLLHLNSRDIFAFMFQFKIETVMFLSGWLVAAVVLGWAATWLKKTTIKTRYLVVVSCFCMALMWWLPGGLIKPIWESIQLRNAQAESINQALQQLDIDPAQYPYPDNIQASAGQNIIVISLESIEQGFLQSPFENLTPHLQSLTKQWTFFNDMPGSEGSDWTAGSLYTLQTGLPALFNQQHFNNNDLFQSSHSFQLTTLVDVLSAAGYNSKYLIGKADFAGMSSILNSLGLEVVSEINSLGRYARTEVGLHDLDLFAEAKLQIEAMRHQEQPFALFMSTINTHFPNGIMDPRLLQKLPAQDSQLEFLIQATDHLLGDFLQHLKDQGLMENTAIYILPDHLLMGNSGPLIKKLKQQPRQLYLLSSSPQEAFAKQPTQTVYQMELPQLIIQGAGIQTNAQFITDFVTTDDTNQFIAEHKIDLAALNNAALSRVDFASGLVIELEHKQLRIQNDEGQSIEVPVRLMQPTEVVEVKFNSDLVQLDAAQISLGEALNNNHIDPRFNYLYLQTFIQNGRIETIKLSNRIDIAIEKSNAPFEFYAADIAGLMAQQQAKLNATQNGANAAVSLTDYGQDPMRFIAHAGGVIGGRKYTNSLEALNHNYAQGFRLFELDIIATADDYWVAAHDWPQWQRQTQYTGDLPPDLETFKALKLWNQYTTMDLAAINQWFAQHPDAILVTDKINHPEQLLADFDYPDRLMMELFSWPAVEQALQLGIHQVMPTGDLLLKVPGNKIQYLKQLGIQNMAVSRRWINQHVMLLRQLSAAGFRLYAFHVNFDAGKDETHVVCRERNFFYGLYADQWDFNTPEKCP